MEMDESLKQEEEQKHIIQYEYDTALERRKSMRSASISISNGSESPLI